VVRVDASPVGDDVSIALIGADGDTALWTINGVAADAETCAAVSATHVELRFLDGGVARSYDAFRFPCTDGTYDSRPNRVLSYGTFQTQWALLDEHRVIAEAPAGEPFTTESPAEHVDLRAPEFRVDGTDVPPRYGAADIALRFEVTQGASDYGSCAAAGVATIAYELRHAERMETTSEAATECDDAVSLSDLFAGTYELTVRGRRTSDTEDTWSGPPCLFSVMVGETSTPTCSAVRVR
jgi:hypothetical protein